MRDQKPETPPKSLNEVLSRHVDSDSHSRGNSENQEFEIQNFSTQVAYDEMADVPVHYVDPVEQVQKNLAHLEELQSRMKFMMREVRYLLKM